MSAGLAYPDACSLEAPARVTLSNGDLGGGVNNASGFTVGRIGVDGLFERKDGERDGICEMMAADATAADVVAANGLSQAIEVDADASMAPMATLGA